MSPHFCERCDTIEEHSARLNSLSNQMIRVEEWFVRADERYKSILECLDTLDEKLSGKNGICARVERHGVMLQVGSLAVGAALAGLVTLIVRIFSQ